MVERGERGERGERERERERERDSSLPASRTAVGSATACFGKHWQVFSSVCMVSLVACEYAWTRLEGRKEQVEGRVRGWHLPEKKISLLDGCVFLLFLFPCFVVPSSFYVNTHSTLSPSTSLHSPFFHILTSFIYKLTVVFVHLYVHPSAGELYTFLRTVCASKGNGHHLPPHILLRRFCCFLVIRLVSIMGEQFKLPTCVPLLCESAAVMRSIISNRTFRCRCNK